MSLRAFRRGSTSAVTVTGRLTSGNVLAIWIIRDLLPSARTLDISATVATVAIGSTTAEEGSGLKAVGTTTTGPAATTSVATDNMAPPIEPITGS